MKHHVSTRRQPWIRTAVYTFMTLTVTVIVALLMLVVLGYQFNEKDGRLEQGGLLQFQSTPSGARVTLDEMRLGALTSTKTTTESGNHFVTYDLDGYRQWRKSITIKPGQIGWLNYARMIPTTITPEKLHEYTTLTDALSSPNRKYMLLHEAPTSTEFTLVDIQGETLRYTPLSIPSGLLTTPTTNKKQTIKLYKWSVDDQGILVQHLYDGNKTEWILLDRDSPNQSVNINVSYGITPSRVEFAGTGSRALFVQIADIVRRVDLGAETLSRPLVTNVADFNVYGDKMVAYATMADSKGKRSVGYASMDIPKPVTLQTYDEAKLPLHIALSHYFNDWYVAIVHGTQLTIQMGNFPTDKDNGSLKQVVEQVVSTGVTSIEVVGSDRFVVLADKTGYGTYDLELQKYDHTKWTSPAKPQEDLHWLDDYMLWSDYGDRLRFYEFDGANQQDIMPAAPGFTTSLSPNGKYVYNIAATDKGYVLQRARLQL